MVSMMFRRVSDLVNARIKGTSSPVTKELRTPDAGGRAASRRLTVSPAHRPMH